MPAQPPAPRGIPAFLFPIVIPYRPAFLARAMFVLRMLYGPAGDEFLAKIAMELEQAQAKVSRWKPWWPAAVMMLCSLLSYLDRQTLAVLSPTILSETKLNTQAYGQIVSAFSFAYMIGNPIWGSILDRIGLRLGMILAVGLWTIASGSHALLSGFLGFAAARALLGFGEGATFPGGLRTVTDSLPPGRQSRGLALAYSGGSLGAVLTPLIVTPIAVAFGWRAAFLVTGVAGVIWLLIWARTVDFSSFRVSERTNRITPPNLWERRFWSLVAAYGLGGLPLAPILYLAPLYLRHALHFSQGELGRVLWIPPLGWEAGYFFWGWITDRFAARETRPRRLLFLLAALSLPTAAITLSTNPAAVLALMFWTMFVASGFVVVSLRAATLSYPKEQTALVAGIGAGSWSAIVAVVLPWLGRLFDQQAFGEAFLAVALIPVLGTALWAVLTPAPRSS